MIYGSRFRLILLTRFFFIQDFLAFASNLLPAPLSRRIRVPHFPAIKNISSCFCLIRAASMPLLQILNVQKVRLRFIFARALYLWRLFSKKLTVKGTSEPTRTSVVPYRSEFACKLVAQECTGRTFLGGAVQKVCKYGRSRA